LQKAFGAREFSPAPKLANFHFTGTRVSLIFAALMFPITIFINILLVIHVLVSLLIILIVLMQRPKNEGLGAAFGGGMTDNLFGAQTTNVLQTITRWLGGIFFVLTVALSILYVRQGGSRSAVQEKLSNVPVPSATTPVPPASTPGSPAPLKDASTSLDDSGSVKLEVPRPEATTDPVAVPLPGPDLGTQPLPALPDITGKPPSTPPANPLSEKKEPDAPKPASSSASQSPATGSDSGNASPVPPGKKEAPPQENNAAGTSGAKPAEPPK
jgi:preprotein translocase subunit SecG